MDKESRYKELITKAEALVDANVDIIANMANLSALIHSEFQFHWVGFYRVIDNSLLLGPFHGPVACTRIEYNKGVCGSSWASQRTLIVDNVEDFPGHIACSPYSKSEIVVPCFRDKQVFAVLDIDSAELNTFDKLDQKYLEKVVALL